MNALSYVYEYLVLPIDHFKVKKNRKEQLVDSKHVVDNEEHTNQDTEGNDKCLNTKAQIRVNDDSVLKLRKVNPLIQDKDGAQKDRDSKTRNVSNSKIEIKPVSDEDEEKDIDGQMSRGLKFFIVVWSIITFFPNYILIKPTLFVWFILTFPLSLIEHSVRRRGKATENEHLSQSPATNKGNSPSKRLNVIEEAIEDDLISGEVMELQKDAVKGSLLPTNKDSSQNSSQKDRGKKTTSTPSHTSNILGTKSMGRFQFPKKLIPRSILYSEKKKTLVIDLDETLIHSVSRGTTHSNSSQAHIIEVRFAISGVSTLYYVHKRPYCDLFLSKVCKWYNLIIFTASMKEYADPVIDWLESSFSGSFTQRMYRNHCIARDGVGYIKDLGNIKDPYSKNATIPLTDVVIIDNSPVSYAMHVDNAIQVEGWISDPTDTELLNLLPFLEALRYTTDVRNVLALKNSEKAFQLS